MFQKDDRKAMYILPASTLASLISALIVNPLDVLKVRQQKGSSQECHIHNRPQLNYSYMKSCLCLDKKSLVSGIAQIWRMEGVKTFYNGLKYSLYSSTASTVTYFYFYETSTKQIRNRITDHKIYLPLLASVFSRSLTTTLTFPLEYWRTVQQAQIGFTKKSGLQLGNRVFSAYFVTLQRDVIFSSLYWVLAENIRDSLHGFWCNYPYALSKYSDEHQEYHKSHPANISCRWKFLITNIIAGSVGGGITALLTLPLDVIKTKRQLYEKYSKDSTISIMKQIVQTDGVSGLYAGARPRIAKVVVACSTVLSLYEYFLGICKSLY
ncbi:hypothetical protein ABPG74_009496 [Tetrahymena malaccensis]